ncbi:hypothetical protein OG485_08360 [Streptomyces sp. NBC_00328]|nr:hypothetical protein [Streptomyces sp. NBC_00328]
MTGVVRPRVWVIGNVSFPNCGKESVGVARQYCGEVRSAPRPAGDRQLAHCSPATNEH